MPHDPNETTVLKQTQELLVLQARLGDGAAAKRVLERALAIVEQGLHHRYHTQRAREIAERYATWRIEKHVLNPEGKYDPERGRLRTYLKKVVRWAWLDACGDGLHDREGDLEQPELNAAPREDTPELDALPPQIVGEHKCSLNPRDFQIIRARFVEHRPVDEVARLLQVTVEYVQSVVRSFGMVAEFYAEGRSSSEVAQRHQVDRRSVFEITRSFRTQCHRPALRAMSDAGFGPSEIKLVEELRFQQIKSLDQSEERFRTWSCLKSLAKNWEIDPVDACYCYELLLDLPNWGAGTDELDSLRTMVLQQLRDDPAWIAYELARLGLVQPEIAVYVKLWSRRSIQAVAQWVRKKYPALVAGAHRGRNARNFLRDALERISAAEPEYYDNLPWYVRRWMRKSES